MYSKEIYPSVPNSSCTMHIPLTTKGVRLCLRHLSNILTNSKASCEPRAGTHVYLNLNRLGSFVRAAPIACNPRAWWFMAEGEIGQWAAYSIIGEKTIEVAVLQTGGWLKNLTL